jgi:hypothetical protein
LLAIVATPQTRSPTASPFQRRVSCHTFSTKERAEVAINFPLPASSYIRRFYFQVSFSANQTTNSTQAREITHFDSFPRALIANLLLLHLASLHALISANFAQTASLFITPSVALVVVEAFASTRRILSGTVRLARIPPFHTSQTHLFQQTF